MFNVNVSLTFENNFWTDSTIHKKEDRQNQRRRQTNEIHFINWSSFHSNRWIVADWIGRERNKQKKNSSFCEEHLNSFKWTLYQNGRIQTRKLFQNSINDDEFSRRQKKLIVYNIDQIRGFKRVYFWLSFQWFP